MIQSVQEQELILTSNTAPITFADTDLRTASANCQWGWLNHNEGSALFNIVAGGIYEIEFHSDVTSATAGQVSIGIFADGTLLQGATASTVIGAPGEWENISMDKKIRVCTRGNVSITIASIPTTIFDGTVTDTEIPIIRHANISIERLA